MISVLGGLMVLLGVAAGAYMGFWFMLVGGVIQIAEAVSLSPVPAGEVAVGIIRVFAAGPVGWACAALLIIPGVAMIMGDR